MAPLLHPIQSKRNLQSRMTTDIDIRTALRQQLQSEFAADPATLILDELGLSHGNARVDVAVINGIIHGFELKSDSDTLKRLPDQIAIYGTILDKVTIISGQRHIPEIANLIPAWWGITLAEMGSHGAVRLTAIKAPEDNPSPNALAIARLLWRNEALALLESLNLAQGYRSKPRGHIYQRLAEATTLSWLRHQVCKHLKSRTSWRSASQYASCGD